MPASNERLQAAIADWKDECREESLRIRMGEGLLREVSDWHTFGAVSASGVFPSLAELVAIQCGDDGSESSRFSDDTRRSG